MSYVLQDFAKARPGPSDMISAKSRRIRLIVLVLFALFWCAVVFSRLFSLQVADFERWQDWALKQHFAELRLSSERGPILDRDGKLLAISVPAQSVYVRPRQVVNKEETAGKIALTLEMPAAEVLERLNQKKPFVWIRRQVPRAVGEQVAVLKLPGVGSVLESKRVYPFNEAASTLVGKVGIDGVGLSGLESVYERELHGEQLNTKAVRDAFGKLIQVTSAAEDFSLPKGQQLRLTIDTGIQMIVDEELEAGRKSALADAALAVMVDSDTGEVLAMSQAPLVNLNAEQIPSPTLLKNLLVETVFEPGSVMKPLVAAAALEEKVVRPEEIVNCESGQFLYAHHLIKDVHPSASIPFFDVVVRSSNIGMTKVGIRLGAERLYRYLRAFGFGESTNLGLPGESAGILRNVDTWAQVDVATHSFGQGVAVTPLQAVRALAAIANGGRVPALQIVDSGESFASHRVISEGTAAKVREMLYGVVEDEHGTGGKAAIDGVRIGGKTGTAQKARKDGRGYAPGSYVASFAGFADATSLGIKQSLTLIVVIDEPHAKTIYGGTLAAPVFQRIMQRSLHLLATRNELKVPVRQYLETGTAKKQFNPTTQLNS
jgi:cell division protein FtsI (penicillin-binding protein 3)